MMLFFIKKNCVLAYTLLAYSDVYGYASACDIYTLCYIFEGKTGDIFTFSQFDEGNLLSETFEDTGSDDKYDDD